MKIIKKPVNGIVACPLCNCEFAIKGKNWRYVERNNRTYGYGIHCPICHHFIKIVPGEIRCAK